MKNLTLGKIREAHKKSLVEKNLKWFRSQGFTGTDFNLMKEAERFAIVDLQLEQDWTFTSRTDLSDLPKWVKQLYWYELSLMYPHKDKQKITLAGTINPNPDKYRMVDNDKLQDVRDSLLPGEHRVRDNEHGFKHNGCNRDGGKGSATAAP